MKVSIAAFITGFIFGLGLILSEMVNPLKVKGFLDITGLWDPTLAFVMIGALGVTFFGYRWIFKQPKPLFAVNFQLTKNTIIDRQLIIGALMFGIGWGISGLCPGPAITGLATLNMDILIFFIAMLAGMKIYESVSAS